MQPIRRHGLVYGLMFVVWGAILAWQAAEHARVRQSARVGLINRAKDISDTAGLVMRSQRRFGGVISKDRLESALHELVKPGELTGIALLNAGGQVVASAGEPIETQPQGLTRNAAHWEKDKVTLVNLVDLGANIVPDFASTNLTIVMPRREHSGGGDSAAQEGRDRGRRPREGRQLFGRPPWMDEEEFKNLIAKQGVHGFVLIMSTQPVAEIMARDFWLRGIIALLATVSVIGSIMAWRNVIKSSDLQVRLVRASELNTHLREMNLAAAGLAHETRNPLNIIRGLAQMISRQDDASSEIQQKSRDIINEADRVTVQVNEFINYSRPREVRFAPVALPNVVAEVVRALSYDVEEKNITIKNSVEPLSIQADEQLLRQALFNLVLNAVQAVEPDGAIEISAYRRNGSAALDVSDNGPGVPPENRTQIFKPYVTMTQSGTGLGLAVVQQIVAAHNWEIQCLPNQPRGATFRMSSLKFVAKP